MNQVRFTYLKIFFRKAIKILLKVLSGPPDEVLGELFVSRICLVIWNQFQLKTTMFVERNYELQGDSKNHKREKTQIL